MKKIDLKKNLEERVQYTEWTAKNTWNVLDRISSAKKAPRGNWVRRLAPVMALALVVVYLGVNGLTGKPGAPDPVREQYTARPMVTALAAGQGEGTGDLEAGQGDSAKTISDQISAGYPEMAGYMKPMILSYENDGIRLELISGAVKGNEVLIVYALQDTEGKYTKGELSPLVTMPGEPEEVKFSYSELLGSDQEKHRYTYCFYANYNRPVESGDRMMTLLMNGYLVQRRAKLDLVGLLEKYGSEGLALKKLQGTGSEVLDTAGLQEVPVLEDVVLTGIGWAEGRLHAQFHGLNSHLIEGRYHEADESWFVSLEYDDQYNEDENLHSYSGWTEQGERSVSWIDHELNCTREMLEEMRPMVSVYSTDELVEGHWEISFPLSMIRTESGPEAMPTAEAHAAAEETPVPAVEITDDTRLYYNAEGGEKYHLDPGCRAVAPRYSPLQDSFSYAESGNPQYRHLQPCEVCGAPALKPYTPTPAEEYTRQAWPVTEEEGYQDLLEILGTYAEKRQVYTVAGTVQEILSEDPLRVRINAGGDTYTLPVVIEEPVKDRFRWQSGEHYRIYGEVAGDYDGMPLLLAGYSYTEVLRDDQEPENGAGETEPDHLNSPFFGLEEVKDELKPIGLSVDRQGIRMTLISGLVSGKEAWLVYSLEDPEEKYTGADVWTLRFTNTLETVTEVPDEERPGIIHEASNAEINGESSIAGEEDTNVFVRWLKFPDEIDTTERTIRAGAECVKIERKTLTDLNTALEEHGKTAEGLAARSFVRRRWERAVVKVLDCSDPLNIPLGREDILLTGIGWIDGQLHVQVQNKAASEFWKGTMSYGPAFEVSVFGLARQDDGTVDVQRTKELDLPDMPVKWSDSSNGSVQQYEEWILDCKPDEPIDLYATVTALEDVLEDDWTVEFPLGMICAEEA